MNWLAIIIAAAAQMALGFLWYGPLFGKTWMSLMGITPQRPQSASMGTTYAWSAVASLVTAFMLSRFVEAMAARDVGAGVTVGFWIWLGFVATVTLASVLYERRSTSLYFLNNGYQLISLAIMGAILAVWR